MTESRPISTPISTSPTLSLQSDTTLYHPTVFRTIVGRLRYLKFNRLKVAYAVNKLSQFMHHPNSNHWTAIKHILSYLCGTIDHGVLLHRQSQLQLHAYSDADWAGKKDDFTSTNAFIIYLSGNPISWSSKKQRRVA